MQCCTKPPPPPPCLALLACLPACLQTCGSSNASQVAGTAGYLAPISCDVFYQYAWYVAWLSLDMLCAQH